MSNFNFTVTTEVEESLAVEGGLCTAATPGLWEITDLLVKKERDLQVAYQHVAHLEQMNASLWGERSAAVRAEEVLKLCMPIVRDLFAETNSRTVYDQCKAIIAAHEALHVPVAATPAPDPHLVGDTAIRHVSDCQAERPAGVAGGQLSGSAGRQENRTRFAVEVVGRNEYLLGPGNIEEMGRYFLKYNNSSDVLYYLNIPSRTPDYGLYCDEKATATK